MAVSTESSKLNVRDCAAAEQTMPKAASADSQSFFMPDSFPAASLTQKFRGNKNGFENNTVIFLRQY